MKKKKIKFHPFYLWCKVIYEIVEKKKKKLFHFILSSLKQSHFQLKLLNRYTNIFTNKKGINESKILYDNL